MSVAKIKRIISNILSLISLLFPKKKNLWLFGCWSGTLYSDNPKYIFEYINKIHPEIEAVWITRSNRVKVEVYKKGFKCYMRSSFHGVWCALRAETVFITSDEFTDVSPFINRKTTKVIQLWHGFPAKALQWKNDKGEKIFSDKKNRRFADYYWMATSPMFTKVLGRYTNTPAERFYITGSPRNDSFVLKPVHTFMEKLKNANPNTKLIVYLPTHRNFGSVSVDTMDFEWLDRILQQNSMLMVYKPHYLELQKIIQYDHDYSNIIIAKDESIWGDIYEYLHYFDLLISDYSSVIYDFVCLKKPIVLYTYDIELYQKEDSGLSDFFKEIPAGPMCLTWQETVNEVIALLNNDTWEEKRNKCLEVFNTYNDGMNSKRVFDTVKSLTK